MGRSKGSACADNNLLHAAVGVNSSIEKNEGRERTENYEEQIKPNKISSGKTRGQTCNTEVSHGG